MIRLTFVLITAIFSFQALAEAPVVDDSENFALLEQQAGPNPSAALAQSDSYFDANQPALAKETVTVNNASNNADLLNKIQALQQDIQELRGQLEIQTHDIAQLKESQLAFYKDLDARISNKETKAPIAVNTPKPVEQKAPETLAANNPPPIPEPNTPIDDKTGRAPTLPTVVSEKRTNPADEQISYLAAYEQIKNKNYDAGLSAMQSFVANYPTGGYTANAHYWIGEILMVKKNYAEAMTQFNLVLTQFPSSSKYSASMLKLGYALAETGKANEAKLRLKEVIQKYPDTNTAELALAKLKTLGG